ncbi:MAG: threonine synthase [Acidobacteriota bacterium]
MRQASHHPLDRSGVWRFREFLPFPEEELESVVTLAEGNTPVLEAAACARYVGLERLRVKHLGWNPSGSFKDYGMTVAVTRARKLGAKVVACASTGNTSASMAAYCARAGLKGVVFIPEGKIAYGKLSQTLEYGALTVQVEGDFDHVMKLVSELAAERDLYLANSINPFRIEGQKTILLELLDQLDWQIPDRIVVPGGNLGNVASFGKVLEELKTLGWIERIPRLTVIQAEGAAPLHRMLVSGWGKLVPVQAPTTLATAIRIGRPVNWRKAVRALGLSNGSCESVSEEEIADAKAILGRDGIGCEPASATTIAGLKKLREASAEDDSAIDPEEEVVAILTGHQLKDSEYTVNYHMEKLFESISGEITPSHEPGYPFSNRPVRVTGDKAEVLKLLDSLSQKG